ncbi:wax ester/triacylglycerol synthase domain-containing protein [Actinophytocola gossypii]|uniref:diacylglycerol O-acyltransferase n=1 Tax=Actinophytocola gossypii TaxID=2812003 RepID=A0ABT2J1M4_9PSEU|nr:wax ester/triacylglycerol synthase domain-containing protein [Actinophytocola gossypii]MCT2581758.1 DUF1298 domain-containing protein [Actinophytocola gossypii]
MTAAPRRLTGLEHAFVTYEARAGNLQIGGLSSFAGPTPALDDVRRSVAARLGALPELGMALRRTGRRLDWVPREVDLTRHVRERVAEQAEWPAVADEIMARRLVRDAPCWELWLLRGRSADEWAILFKAHHALLDGAAMIEATCRIAGHPRRTPAAARPRPARRRGHDLLTVVRGAVRYAARFLPLASHPFTTKGRTGHRRFAWASLPMARLLAVAARQGCTVNDLFLAALATALREWPHTPWRGSIRPVWTLVPADLHERDGDHELSTKVVNLRVALPCDDPDPHRRLRTISAAMAAAKGSGQVGVAGAATRALPGWFVRAVFAVTFSRWHIDLLASNVRGPQGLLHYLGAPLTRMVPLGFVPRRHPLAAYLMTHGDQVCVGFAVDSTLPDGQELCRLWVRALLELDEPDVDGSQDQCTPPSIAHR